MPATSDCCHARQWTRCCRCPRRSAARQDARERHGNSRPSRRSGFVNTAVHMSIYAALNPWTPYLMAHVLGCAVSIVGSFLLNSCITCRIRPTWRGFLRYPVSSTQ
ncbi:GtrA family protein [Streptomyces anulatus]|uniref:GtrA family protein n=1 Tax=Streptomyces anulatus TaxID=1892 RepID=UPI00356B7324